MEVSGQLHAPGRFGTVRNEQQTGWFGGENASWTLRDSNRDPSVAQPVAWSLYLLSYHGALLLLPLPPNAVLWKLTVAQLLNNSQQYVRQHMLCRDSGLPVECSPHLRHLVSLKIIVMPSVYV
jgi:hypothetical protein